MTPLDRDVVLAVRAGDRDAFGVLVDRYQHRLFGLALTMVRDRAGAEDVAQEAFVRAFVHLHRYDDDRPFYPWLATISARLAQNWLRERGRRPDVAPIDDAAEPGQNASALATLIDDEERRTVWRAVRSLTSGERTAVALYYRDHLSIQDAATALGVTAGTIKTLLFRARRHLRARLAGGAAPPGRTEP